MTVTKLSRRKKIIFLFPIPVIILLSVFIYFEFYHPRIVGQPKNRPGIGAGEEPKPERVVISISPNGRQKVLIQKSQWFYVDLTGEHYALPLPLELADQTEEEINYRSQFFWSSSNQYLFSETLEKLAAGRYLKKMIFFRLPLNLFTLEAVWKKETEISCQDSENVRDYCFPLHGAFFSAADNLYLSDDQPAGETAAEDPSWPGQKIKMNHLYSMVKAAEIMPTEKIINQVGFSRSLLGFYKPISTSPKENYLLVIHTYETTFVPIFLLNIKTGEIKEIPVSVKYDIKDGDFQWSENEAVVAFNYYLPGRNAEEFIEGTARYSLNLGTVIKNTDNRF